MGDSLQGHLVYVRRWSVVAVVIYSPQSRALGCGRVLLQLSLSNDSSPINHRSTPSFDTCLVLNEINDVLSCLCTGDRKYAPDRGSCFHSHAHHPDRSRQCRNDDGPSVVSLHRVHYYPSIITHPLPIPLCHGATHSVFGW